MQFCVFKSVLPDSIGIDVFLEEKVCNVIKKLFLNQCDAFNCLNRVPCYLENLEEPGNLEIDRNLREITYFMSKLGKARESDTVSP